MMDYYKYTIHVEDANGNPGQQVGQVNDYAVAEFQAKFQSKLRQKAIYILEHIPPTQRSGSEVVQ